MRVSLVLYRKPSVRLAKNQNSSKVYGFMAFLCRLPYLGSLLRLMFPFIHPPLQTEILLLKIRTSPHRLDLFLTTCAEIDHHSRPPR